MTRPGRRVIVSLVFGVGFMAAQTVSLQPASARVLCLTNSGGFGPCPTNAPSAPQSRLPFTVPTGPTEHLFASGISLVLDVSVVGFVVLGVGLLGALAFVLSRFPKPIVRRFIQQLSQHRN